MAIELDQVLSDFATAAEQFALPGWPAATKPRVISLGSDGESGNAWRLASRRSGPAQATATCSGDDFDWTTQLLSDIVDT